MIEKINDNKTQEKATAPVQRYPKDLGDEIIDKVQRLKLVYYGETL